jgi:hypothetical protein
MRRSALAPALLLLAGCASVTDAPSLAPRPAELIDPRLPVVDGSLARAQSLAASAGPAGSESWIAAQQALSGAIAAQEPVTRALGDFDAAVAERVRSGSRLVPQDLAAVRGIAAELASIDRRHRTAIAEVQRRLAR